MARSRRRASGEGSVYRRPDGLWAAALTTGKKPDGSRRRRVVTAKTQGECLRRFRALQKDVEQDVFTASNRTFGSWADEWLEDYKHHVKTRSYEMAETELRLHIKPRLGETRLKDLTVADVRRLQNELVASHSARTALGARNRVRMILEAAVVEGLVPRNVADAVRRVKQVKSEMNIWNADEVGRFLKANRGARDFPLFYFYLSTGARKSEALALKWEDVHLDAGYLRIRRTITWEAHRPVISEVTKTDAGVRDVPLSARLKEVLVGHREVVQLEARAPGYRFLDLVFPNRKGGIDENPERAWERFKVAAKVSDIRIHDLRHTFVSMCIERGVNVVRLSRMIGHADPGFTLKVYAHLFERQERFELPGLEELLD